LGAQFGHDQVTDGGSDFGVDVEPVGFGSVFGLGDVEDEELSGDQVSDECVEGFHGRLLFELAMRMAWQMGLQAAVGWGTSIQMGVVVK